MSQETFDYVGVVPKKQKLDKNDIYSEILKNQNNTKDIFLIKKDVHNLLKSK